MAYLMNDKINDIMHVVGGGDYDMVVCDDEKNIKY